MVGETVERQTPGTRGRATTSRRRRAQRGWTRRKSAGHERQEDAMLRSGNKCDRDAPPRYNLCAKGTYKQVEKKKIRYCTGFVTKQRFDWFYTKCKETCLRLTCKALNYSRRSCFGKASHFPNEGHFPNADGLRERLSSMNECGKQTQRPLPTLNCPQKLITTTSFQ